MQELEDNFHGNPQLLRLLELKIVDYLENSMTLKVDGGQKESVTCYKMLGIAELRKRLSEEMEEEQC